MSAQVLISKKLVFINSASSLATRLINVSVLLWLHQYLLRRVTLEEYSLYPVLMAVMVFVPLLTTVLTSGLGRYLVEAYTKGEERLVTQIVSTMFPLLLGAGVILLALGWTFAWYIDHILTITPNRLWDARIMMFLLMFSAAVHLPSAPFCTGFYVRQKFVLLNCIRLGTELMRIALLFLLLIGISTRIVWVVVATVSADICRLIVQMVISHQLIPAAKFRLGEIRWTLAKKLMTFGTWHFIGQVANSIRVASDAIVLNKLATPFDVTCFNLGSLPYRQIDQTSSALLVPLWPALTTMHVLRRKESLRNAYLQCGRYALWGACFLAIPAIVYRRELVALYVGEKFLPAATVMALLLLLYPVAYGNLIMYHVAYATAQLGPVTRRVVIIHGVNLLLTLYLVGVRQMGAVGSALSTFLVGLVGGPLLMYPIGWKMVDVGFNKWFRETLWPGLLPGLIAAAIWIGLKSLNSPKSWLIVGAYISMGWLSYVLILFMFCLQPRDRDDIYMLIEKVKSGFLALRQAKGDEPRIS
ncbi:MAG: hypothetical protein ABII09_09705 [Planctomycetota bacterium]